MDKFPQELFVEIKQETDGEFYFFAAEEIDVHAEVGVKHKIGVYQLIEIQEVEVRVVTQKVEE